MIWIPHTAIGTLGLGIDIELIIYILTVLSVVCAMTHPSKHKTFCITCVQRLPNFKCHTNVLCLLGQPISHRAVLRKTINGSYQ